MEVDFEERHSVEISAMDKKSLDQATLAIDMQEKTAEIWLSKEWSNIELPFEKLGLLYEALKEARKRELI